MACARERDSRRAPPPRPLGMECRLVRGRRISRLRSRQRGDSHDTPTVAPPPTISASASRLLLLSVLALPSTAPAGAQEAEAPAPEGELALVETVEGETQEQLLGVILDAPGGGSRVRLRDRELPLREVLRIGFVHLKEPARELIVTLADGSRLSGGIGAESNESQLVFNGPLVPAGISIPLEWLQRLDYTPVEASTEDSRDPVPRSDASIAPDDDAVITRTGGVLTGVVELITGRAVTIKDKSLGVLEQPWENVGSVIIAPLDAPPKLAAGALAVVVTGRDGSALGGELVAVESSELRLRSPLVGEVRVELERIEAIEFHLGRVIALSSRDPVRVREGNPYMSPELFAKYCSFRRDRSVAGGPLVIGERSFRRGLGVHSESRLAFALERGDKTFQAWIGIDASGRPVTDEVEFGSVVFRVLVDGREKLSSGTVNWQAAPRRIEVPLNGGKELELVVEMGEGYHILDRADWGDARILKE